jgi:hypothetical protein
MCSYRRSAIPDELRFHFGAAPPDSDFKNEYYPGYIAPMIRRSRVDSIPGDRSCTLGKGLQRAAAQALLEFQNGLANVELFAVFHALQFFNF